MSNPISIRTTLIAKQEQAKKLLEYVTNQINKQPEEDVQEFKLTIKESGDYTCISYDNGGYHHCGELDHEDIMQQFPDCDVVSSFTGIDYDHVRVNGQTVAQHCSVCNWCIEDEDYNNGRTAFDEPFQFRDETITVSWPLKLDRCGEGDDYIDFYEADFDAKPTITMSHPDGKLAILYKTIFETPIPSQEANEMLFEKIADLLISEILINKSSL